MLAPGASRGKGATQPQQIDDPQAEFRGDAAEPRCDVSGTIGQSFP